MTQNSQSSLNIWHSKPWWCQPWSIILTGITVIIASWLLFHFLWLTIPLSLLIGLWWYYFLLVVPKLFKVYYQSQTNSPEI